MFRELGYNVQQDVFIGGIAVDLVVERDGVRSPVEVIFSNRPENLSGILETAARLGSIVQAHGYVSPVIVVLAPVTAEAKRFASHNHHAQIWDISVLRERSKSLPELRKKLASLTEEGEPYGVVTQRDKEERHTKATLIERVEQHYKYDALSPVDYELLCQEVMTFLFDPHLYGFERQAKTSDGANRYEGLCTRIRWLYMLWRVHASFAKRPCGSARGREPERCGRRCRGEYRTLHAVCGAD